MVNYIGTSGNDVFAGTIDDDVIQGGAGKDFLAGLSGNDIIEGGDGNDTITGGFDSGRIFINAAGEAKLKLGGDILTGGAGADIFKYSSKGSQDEGSDLITDFESGVDKLVLYGAEKEIMDVANGTYIKFGDDRGIIVQGVSSADLAADIIDNTPPAPIAPLVADAAGGILGGTDNVDTIIGGEGDDVIYGKGGNDTITTGNGRNQVAAGKGNDVITGGDGKDFLAGQGGNDTINGGAGNDKIYGGLDTGEVIIDSAGVASLTDGGDVLTGGSGVDIFKYSEKGSQNDGADLITDFEDNIDKLVLYGSYVLTDVANGTFVDFDGEHGVIVEGITAANLTNDILDITPPGVV